MTARDNGRPLSTFLTTVDSGLGRGTANVKKYSRVIHSTKQSTKCVTILQ